MTKTVNQTAKIKRLSDKSAQEIAKSDALFLSIGDGAITTDKDGNIDRINQVALSLLGFKEKDLIGEYFPDVIVATDEHGKRIPTKKRPITQAFDTNATVTARCFYVTKSGSLLPVSVTVSPIMADGKLVGAIEVFRDITEEIEVERMKSDFISIASHQLRTPATAVKTYLAMLLGGMAGELNKKQTEYAKLAFESNERQLHIVNDLLSVAYTESKTLIKNTKEVDLTELVRQVVASFEGAVKERKQSLELNLTEHETACVDPSYIKMVVENLLSNASKYTPEGGEISVSLWSKDDIVALAVSDTGVGIPPRQMDKLFKKFSRIDNPLSSEVGGSGVGLYLIKLIVDLHEGKISVQSKEGKGSKFIVTLPK